MAELNETKYLFSSISFFPSIQSDRPPAVEFRHLICNGPKTRRKVKNGVFMLFYDFGVLDVPVRMECMYVVNQN